jgi:cell division transport system permease protein
MSPWQKLVYVLKEGLAQMVRFPGLSMAVVVIVGAALVQLSLFVGISKILDNALVSARQKFEMAVFLNSSAGPADLQRLQSRLSTDRRVASVRVVGKDEALKDFRKDPDVDRMVQALGENPLTDTISVVLKKDVSEKIDDLAEALKKDPAVEEVDYGKGEWETVSNLSRLARWVGWFLGGFVFLTALFIVSNALTLALWVRREEWVLLSRLGAPSWMRWGPYLWEGLVKGLLGAGVGILVLELLKSVLGWFLPKTGGLEIFLNLPGMDWSGLFLTLVLLGALLGFAGSLWAVRKEWAGELK